MRQHTVHLKPTGSGSKRALRELKTQLDLEAQFAKKREAALARQREHDAAVDEGFTGVEQKREVMELTARLRRLHERGAAESVTLEVAHARVTVPRDAKMVEQKREVMELTARLR